MIFQYMLKSGLCALFLLVTFSSVSSFAIEEANVLPARIVSPIIRFGMVTGIGKRFSSTGQLNTLSDLYTVEFDGATLAQYSSEVTEFIDILNQFGRYELGNQLHLGYLRPEIEPQLNYLAPVISYGLNDKWTFAVGFPVLHYKNQISFVQEGSNVNQLRQQFQGTDQELDNAFDQLSLNLETALQEQFTANGYELLSNQDEWFLGDVQIGALYQYLLTKKWAGLFKSILVLPTGPDDDPDNLLDLDSFGQTAIEVYSLLQRKLTHGLSLLGKIGYRWNISDAVEKRVPSYEDDVLPGPETKENLQRDLGDILTAEVKVLIKPEDYLLLEVGVGHSQKGKDFYSGSRNANYNLLSTNTDSEWEHLIVGAEFNTVNMYKSKKFAIPLLFAYHYNDIFSARNKEKQILHELSLTLFF